MISSALIVVAAAGAYVAAQGGAVVNPAKTIYIKDQTNFCLMLPAVPGISIGESEGNATAKCFGEGVGTADNIKAPVSLILSSHAIKTPDAYQITGRLNLVGLEVSTKEGSGGQYDDAGWGIEPTSHCQGYDRYVEIVGGDTFCLRCCKLPSGMSLDTADHDKTFPCFAGNDISGCAAVVPGEYGPGFDFKEASSLPTAATGTDYQFPAGVFTTLGAPGATTTSSAAPTDATSATVATTGTVAPTSSPAASNKPSAGEAVRSGFWGVVLAIAGAFVAL
ncbi:hypothetical protein HDU97_002024 [Phlyctochytrium planicorne]|nr:hypothetical protein HDU97_002024 [Phlyctochytrium planicorne]